MLPDSHMMAAAIAGIDGLPLVDIGTNALLGIVVLMILTGRLVPASVVKMVERERDRVATERDKWQAAEDVRSKQLSQLMDATGTSTAFIAAVVEPAHQEQ